MRSLAHVLDEFFAAAPARSAAVVFCAHREEAGLVAAHPALRARCRVLHGHIARAARAQVVKDFRRGAFPILVASDVAARGLDFPHVGLVAHWNVPDAETYSQRAGRTGRAGPGRSVTEDNALQVLLVST